MLNLECSNSKHKKCKNRRGRIKKPVNWSDVIPYEVKPEICNCNSIGRIGELKPILAKDKAEVRAKISKRIEYIDNKHGTVRKE